LPAALTMAPFAAAVMITGCGAAVVGLVNAWRETRWGPHEDEQLIASRDNVNALADTVQCGSALPRGPSGVWECIGLGASVIIDRVDKYLTSVNEDEARRRLTSGLVGQYRGFGIYVTDFSGRNIWEAQQPASVVLTVASATRNPRSSDESYDVTGSVTVEGQTIPFTDGYWQLERPGSPYVNWLHIRFPTAVCGAQYIANFYGDLSARNGELTCQGLFISRIRLTR